MKCSASPPAPLIAPTTRSPRGLSTSTIATLAPSAANSLATSSPILRPAPVTTATCSLSFICRPLVPLLPSLHLARGRGNKRGLAVLPRTSQEKCPEHGFL